MKAANSKIKIYHWMGSETLILFEIEAIQRQSKHTCHPRGKSVKLFIFEKRPFITLQNCEDSNNPVGFLAKAVFFHSKVSGSVSTKQHQDPFIFDL
jgi:hypothetical protein